jgi:hypothetical protein
MRIVPLGCPILITVLSAVPLVPRPSGDCRLHWRRMNAPWAARSTASWLLLRFATTLAAVGLAACGETRPTVAASSQRVAAPTTTSARASKPTSLHVQRFGRTATRADERAVASLVRRYIALAVVGDGGKACSMLLPRLAKSVAEDYGQAPAPRYLRGETCATVMTKLFRHYRHRLLAEAPLLKVVGVRVRGHRAIALLRFGTALERQILLDRERGSWRIAALLDTELD